MKTSIKEKILIELEQIARKLHQRIEKHQASGRTLTLKIKFADYQQITRSKTFENYINSVDLITSISATLLETINLEGKSIRLLGISLSNLENEKELQAVQLSLF